MGGSDSGGKTTTIQDIPAEFKPAFTSLFNSGFGAARTAAGQNGFNTNTGFNSGFEAGGPFDSGFGQGTSQFGGPSFGGGGQFGTGFNNPQGGGQGGGDGFNFVNDGNIKPGGFFGAGTGVPLAAGPPIIGEAFGGQFLSGPNPYTLDSLQQRAGVADQVQGLGNPLLQLGTDTAEGKYLDFTQNPFAMQALMNSLQPAVSQFNNSIMPQFNSQALQSGAFKGSSARDLAFNQLGDAFGGNLARTAGDFGFQNYIAERQLQQNAGNLLDQGARLNQLSPEILGQVGQGYQDIYQSYLDEQLLQFQEQQQAPFRPLMPLASIIQGSNIGSNFTNFGPTPSKFAGGITGALGGAAAGAGFSSAMNFGNTGTGLSSGIGALLGGGLGALTG